ncbi:MAG: thioredoxin domain-containing protein [Candidatus Sumerlaeaceae bacterium]|nr:thioredoxin domain-containing protein [Candidatus Sumerlaeaceae bacterium]
MAAAKNEAATASSAYVRGAAQSPVFWQPWTDAAFERAKALNRPVLVSIGTNWCPLCYQMDATTYMDKEVAKALNDGFVAIKVDADERPDINERFQAAHYLINRQAGGWPLTAFVLPDGRVFESLTYIPPKSSGDKVGMVEILKQVQDVYTNQRPAVEKQATLVEAGVARSGLDPARKAEAKPAALSALIASVEKDFDSQRSGFGPAKGPKFPSGTALVLLLQSYSDSGDKERLGMVTRTLTNYYRSGLRDHVMGGFFRYTSDGEFRKPHFEKKLHVQAELLSAYCLAYAASRQSLLKEAAQEILRFSRETLENEGGGFFASQAADVEPGDNGAFYRYSVDEVKRIAGDADAAVFNRYLSIGAEGNTDKEGRSVPFAASSLQAAADALGVTREAAQKSLDSARAKLRAERTSRDKQPYVDKTIIAAWNALMISAYLDAYRYLGDARARDFALRTADFLLEKMVSETDGVARSLSKGQISVYGLLEDQVLLAAALIDCFEVSGNKDYLDTALSLMEFVEAKFLDPATGLYLDRVPERGAAGLLATPRFNILDNPTPAPNAVAAINWYRFYQATQDEKHLDKARRLVDIVVGQEQFGGTVAATYGLALSYILNAPPKVLIIGEPDDTAVSAMREAALPVFRMGKLVETLTPDQAKSTDYKPAKEGGVIVYVCTAENCAPPTNDKTKVVELIKTFGRPKSETDKTESSAEPQD